jgi:hypothetical protein
MVTYIAYLFFGTVAVIAANVTWLTIVWFIFVALDWSTSIYNHKTRIMKCNACGNSVMGFMWVKKNKPSK